MICIDKSINGSLINADLEDGDYIIVVEEAPLTNSVTFLDSPVISSTQDVTLEYQLSTTLIEDSIEVTLDSSDAATAIITSMNGSQVLTQAFTNQTSLNLSSVPHGMYFLTLYSGQNTVTERIIKM